MNNNYRIFSEENSLFNNKICSNIYKKNRSDNGLPFLVCNQFNKYLISGINPISDNSTKNSSSIMREKTLNIKKKIGINIYVRLTPENLDKIIDSKKKPFEALENLIQNDIIEEETKENDNNLKIEDNSQNKIYKTQNTQNIINDKNKKKKKGISVPKLDFTSIYKHYSKRTLRIQEVEYFSKYIKENDDSESSHHYNHYHHKSTKKKN